MEEKIVETAPKKHKVVITSGPNGSVKGTQVLVDGEVIDKIIALKLENPMDGFFTLTISHHVKNENGGILVAQGGAAVVTKTLVFQGEVTLEGELLE